MMLVGAGGGGNMDRTMADETGQRYRGGPHRGGSRSAPYPVSRLAPPCELVDLAREIQRADDVIGARVSGQLAVIAEQIRTLQDQARAILEQTRRDQELHRVPCAVQRRPGQVYHLYRRDDGSRYFALLSPEDWGGRPPHRHEGAYRLEADMSWRPVEQQGAGDN